MLDANATLSRDDYCSAEVFAAEQRQIFHAGWFYVFHVDGLPAGMQLVGRMGEDAELLALGAELVGASTDVWRAASGAAR